MHRTTAELEGGLAEIDASPEDEGRLALIVARPGPAAREVLAEGWLDATTGLVGDDWSVRPSRETPDGGPHPAKQITLINSRFAELIAVDPDRRALTGDQLHLDLDLSEANLPPGTRLAVGAAVIEVNDAPHRGCAKFVARFGAEALRFARSAPGRARRLRGAHATVVVPGPIRVGDCVTKQPTT